MSDGGIESLSCQVQIRDKVSSVYLGDQESCLSGNTEGNGSGGNSEKSRNKFKILF